MPGGAYHPYGTPWRGCHRVPSGSKGFRGFQTSRSTSRVSLTYTSVYKEGIFQGGGGPGGQKQTLIKMWIHFLSTKKYMSSSSPILLYSTTHLKGYCGHNRGIPGGAGGCQIPGGSVGPWHSLRSAAVGLYELGSLTVKHIFIKMI